MQNFASVNLIGTFRVDICSLECKLFETCLKFRIAIAPGGTSLLHWVSGWPPSTIVLCISYCLYCLGCLSQSCHLLKTGVPKFNPLILQEIQKSANIATKPNGLVVHASTGIESVARNLQNMSKRSWSARCAGASVREMSWKYQSRISRDVSQRARMDQL